MCPQQCVLVYQGLYVNWCRTYKVLEVDVAGMINATAVINQGFPSEINNAVAVLTVSRCRKVISWFRLQRRTIGLKNSRQFFHPIRSKIKTNRNSLARFPTSATCINYEFWLVHWIVRSFWLVRVITWVLRHSASNRGRCTRDPSKHPRLETEPKLKTPVKGFCCKNKNFSPIQRSRYEPGKLRSPDQIDYMVTDAWVRTQNELLWLYYDYSTR